MTDLLANIALIATGIAFAAGFLLTAITGSATPVKTLLAILTGLFIAGFVAGLVFSRGLLIYLLFQIIASIMLWYIMVIIGAVCGGGMYLWMNRKPPGRDLGNVNLQDYLGVPEFSTLEGITAERAISRIKSGFYQGGLHQGAWYIHKSELSRHNNHGETV